MVLIQSNNAVAAIVSLCCAVTSFISCAAIISSIYLYNQKKTSYHLQLVGRLLLSDMGLSACIVFYFIIQYALDTDELRQFCKGYLPLVIFNFLSSFCWTIMLALRFHSTQNVDSGNAFKPLEGLNKIWLLPLFVSVIVLLVSAITGKVTTVHTNSSDTNQSCTFDHDNTEGIVIDLLTFQAPMILTIIINTYYYGKGIYVLRNSPHSVIGRQMRRAGGYLGVLLIVTVPNLLYNLLSICNYSGKNLGTLLDVAVFLSSLQVSEYFHLLFT